MHRNAYGKLSLRDMRFAPKCTSPLWVRDIGSWSGLVHFVLRSIYEWFDNSCCQNSITCISSSVDGTGVDQYSGATPSISASLRINSSLGIRESFSYCEMRTSALAAGKPIICPRYFISVGVFPTEMSFRRMAKLHIRRQLRCYAARLCSITCRAFCYFWRSCFSFLA